MFILISKYLKDIEEIDKYVGAHRSYLDKYYKSNNLICSGPQIPRTGGVIVANFNSREEVEEMLSNDPFKINGISEYEIIEFDSLKYHKDFKHFIY